MFSFSKLDVQWANRQHFGDKRFVPCESKLPLGSRVLGSASRQELLASLGLSAALRAPVLQCLCVRLGTGETVL